MNKRNVRLVQMIPLRRCGSHALRLRLGFDPQFYSPYPLHVVDFKPLVPLYGDLKNDENYFAMVADLLGLQALSMVRWSGITIEPLAFFDKIKHKPRSLQSATMEILIEAAEQKSKTVVMDKSLDNVHDWEELISLYPEMLFLNIVRDPRAQIASMNRAIIHEFDTLLNTMIWQKAVTAAEALQRKYPEKVLTLRFEDWLSAEEASLKRVCEFLGLPFSPQMMEIGKSEEAKRISKQSKLWESNSSKPIAAHADKFRAQLSEQEILVIESLAGDFMKKHGYERITTGKVSPSEAEIEKARVISAEGRQKAWEKMRIENPFDYTLRMQRRNYLEMCRRAREK